MKIVNIIVINTISLKNNFLNLTLLKTKYAIKGPILNNGKKINSINSINL